MMLRMLLAAMLLALPASAEPIAPGAVEVMVGDTVRAHGVVYRLIGLDAPETKSRAKCEAERTWVTGRSSVSACSSPAAPWN